MRRARGANTALWLANGLLVAGIITASVVMFVLHKPPTLGELPVPEAAQASAGGTVAGFDQIRTAREALHFPHDSTAPATGPTTPVRGLEEYIVVRSIFSPQGAAIDVRNVAGGPHQWVMVFMNQPVNGQLRPAAPELEGVVLVGLERDAALFRRGSDTPVRIPRTDAAATGPIAQGTTPRVNVNTALQGQPYDASRFSSEERGPYWLIDPAERDWLLANEATAMSQIQLVPNEAGEGLRVAGVTPGSIWESRGVMAGDVIMRINQHTVSTPSEVQTLRQQLSEENPSQISLLIQRGGRQVVRVFRMRQ